MKVTKRVFLAQDLVARTRVELQNVGRGVKVGQISCKRPHGISPLVHRTRSLRARKAYLGVSQDPCVGGVPETLKRVSLFIGDVAP